MVSGQILDTMDGLPLLSEMLDEAYYRSRNRADSRSDCAAYST
jgi:hypothetical protein